MAQLTMLNCCFRSPTFGSGRGADPEVEGKQERLISTFTCKVMQHVELN